MPQQVHFKIVLLGSGSVGKSAIATRYVKNTWLGRYDPTIEETFSKTIEVDKTVVQLEIYDTAGTEQFRTLQDLYMKEGNGFILVFSIVSKATFQDLDSIYQHIIEVKTSMNQTFVPIIIAGNKADLAAEREKNGVSAEEASEYAKTHNCTYMETSAKTQQNINEMFEFLSKELIEHQPAKKKGGCSLL